MTHSLIPLPLTIMHRSLIAIFGFCAVIAFNGCSQNSEAHSKPVEIATPTLVDAGCGRCLFARKEDKKCNLAIRTDGNSYFVDGFNIKQFGNPDLKGGMCKKVYRAHVTGKVVSGRFAAISFELLTVASR